MSAQITCHLLHTSRMRIPTVYVCVPVEHPSLAGVPPQAGATATLHTGVFATPGLFLAPPLPDSPVPVIKGHLAPPASAGELRYLLRRRILRAAPSF
jgi:hypothetical protein